MDSQTNNKREGLAAPLVSEPKASPRWSGKAGLQVDGEVDTAEGGESSDVLQNSVAVPPHETPSWPSAPEKSQRAAKTHDTLKMAAVRARACCLPHLDRDTSEAA